MSLSSEDEGQLGRSGWLGTHPQYFKRCSYDIITTDLPMLMGKATGIVALNVWVCVCVCVPERIMCVRIVFVHRYNFVCTCV